MSENRFLLLFVCAVLVPPVAVYLLRGIGWWLLASVVLTLVGWLPGVIHAFATLAIQARQDDALARAVREELLRNTQPPPTVSKPEAPPPPSHPDIPF